MIHLGRVHSGHHQPMVQLILKQDRRRFHSINLNSESNHLVVFRTKPIMNRRRLFDISERTKPIQYTGVSLIGPSSFLVCQPKHVVRFRKRVYLLYDRGILSFSAVNAAYFHELLGF